MATTRQVYGDLKEIRYYYAKRTMFESASKCIVENGIIEKVNRFNRAMINAPPRLYEVYYCLYVSCATQAELAERLGCSKSHIKQLNSKLCAYLVQKFNDT